MTQIRRQLEHLFPWLLLVPALLPLVIWGGVLYPYLVPKTLLFYSSSLVSAAVWLVLLACGQKFFWTRLRKWETWIPAALLILAYGTSFFGVDFYRSFWSLLIRGDGLLMLTGAVVQFYLILLSADRLFFERLLRVVAVVASAVAMYGIGEWLGGGGRIGSLLGNAAFFAGYLGIAFFATLAAAQTLSGGWRNFTYLGAAAQIVAIVLTATRGTLLALAVASGLFVVLQMLIRKGRPRIVAGTTLLAFLAVSSAFFVFRSELSHSSFEPVARIASISTTENDVASRLFIWQNMVTEIQKSPVVGVGAEHIDSLFNRFYDPTLIAEQWFDRSHNAFLDYAAQYGLGGLLLYVLLISSFFIVAARFARRDPRTATLFALLATTYAVQNFFVFDTISSFWLLLALLSAGNALSQEDARPVLWEMKESVRPVLFIVAAVLFLSIIPVSIRPMMAAYDLHEAYVYQLVDVTKEVAYLSDGFARGTYADREYGYQAYDMYANVQAARLTGTDRMNAYRAALSILTENFTRYTYDARTALYLASVLSLAPTDATVDQDLFSSALERAIRLSPKRAQPWYLLANLSISNANQYPILSPERVAGYAAAQDILKKYIEMVPNLSAPHFVLAQLLFAVGQKEDAAIEAEKGRVAYRKDLDTARRAVGYYENVLDLTNAKFFLKEVIHLDGSDVGAQSDLKKIEAYESTK